MWDREFVEQTCNRICQKVSYRISDLILSYPDFMRPMVIGTIRACMEAQLKTMPAEERELCDLVLEKMEVISVPEAVDPRKKGGPAS